MSLSRTQRFVKAVQGEAENYPPELAQATGATAHALAISHDTGKRFILTGHDSQNRRIRREVHSFTAAYAVLLAAWGYTRVWQEFDPAKRRMLVFERAAAR